MKKMMKALLLTGICGSMMVTGFAFADDTTADDTTPGYQHMTEEDRQAKREEMQAKREAKKAENEAKKEDQQVRTEERQAKLLELAETYAADLVDDFENAFDELEALREAFQELREDKIETIKAEVEAIREQVQNGDMTREEAREAIQALKPERDGESNKPSEEERAANQEKRQAFKAAIESGDADTIADMLEDILENIEAHIAEKTEKLSELQ